jgi:hypothetical protein
MGVGRFLAAALAIAALVAVAAVVGSRETGEPRPAAAADAPPGNDWSFARSMSQRRSYLAAAEMDGEIFAAGGMVGETGRFLDVFQRFDPRTNTWTTLPRLPEPVRAAAGAASGGIVYVLGGQTADGTSATVYAYDPAAQRWEEKAPLPEPLFNQSAVELGGRIYALGGFSGGSERADVFVYDPARDSWQRGRPLPAPNHAFGAVAFRGEIWVLGGRRGSTVLRDVWIYDPDVDAWRRGPTMPKPMELVGAAVAGSRIHAIWESTYQVYDAATGRWSDGPESLVTRHGLKAFVVDGTLYTVGGCTTDLHDSQVVERRRVA